MPAIFSVTTDTFLVFSSNAFAILGLRSLYFLLAGAVDKFRYLKPGLAALLIFAGLKTLLADILPIPIALSLAIIVAILAVADRGVRGRRPPRPAQRCRGPRGSGAGWKAHLARVEREQRRRIDGPAGAQVRDQAVPQAGRAIIGQLERSH